VLRVCWQPGVRLNRVSPVRAWAIWRLRRRAVAFLLISELIAAAGLVLCLRQGLTVDGYFWRGVLLLGTAILFTEASTRIERLNKYVHAEGASNNQNSVLCFAGVTVLPTADAVALAVLVYAHAFVSNRRSDPVAPHKEIFTLASVLLATFGASAVLHVPGVRLSYVGPLDAALILLAIVVYTVLNLAVVLAGLRLVTGAPLVELMPDRPTIGYENTTLLFGAFTGILVLHAPWLSLLVLFMIASLHRASLVTNLQQRARTDSRTGLLNAGGWQLLARQHLAQCAEQVRPAAVLLIDLDHFKRINDTHGHLAGDEVLREVAEILVRELRGYDAVGRYGGEEFIALLPGVSGLAAAGIGERLRERVGSNVSAVGISVTASIGVAASVVGQSPALEDIIDAADTALYEAKETGRNRVCLAPPVNGRPSAGQPDRRQLQPD